MNTGYTVPHRSVLFTVSHHLSEFLDIIVVLGVYSSPVLHSGDMSGPSAGRCLDDQVHGLHKSPFYLPVRDFCERSRTYNTKVQPFAHELHIQAHQIRRPADSLVGRRISPNTNKSMYSTRHAYTNDTFALTKTNRLWPPLPSTCPQSTPQAATQYSEVESTKTLSKQIQSNLNMKLATVVLVSALLVDVVVRTEAARGMVSSRMLSGRPQRLQTAFSARPKPLLPCAPAAYL